MAKTQQENIGKLDADSADLEKDLLTHQQRYLERIQLDDPRTICTSPKCTSVSINEFGQSTTVYTTHCHPLCYLENVREEAKADPGLRECAAMQDVGGSIRCKVCIFNYVLKFIFYWLYKFLIFKFQNLYIFYLILGMRLYLGHAYAYLLRTS